MSIVIVFSQEIHLVWWQTKVWKTKNRPEWWHELQNWHEKQHSLWLDPHQHRKVGQHNKNQKFTWSWWGFPPSSWQRKLPYWFSLTVGAGLAKMLVEAGMNNCLVKQANHWKTSWDIRWELLHWKSQTRNCMWFRSHTHPWIPLYPG